MQLVIVRSYTEVRLSSGELFTLLASEEGAKILDDTTNHTDPPLATLHWKGRYMHCAALQNSHPHAPAPCRTAVLCRAHGGDHSGVLCQQFCAL